MSPPETSPIVYRKLRGRGRPTQGLVTSPETHRLWLGPDHLLLVQTTYWSEEYKRFYFRDIRAVTIKSNGRNPGIPIALGLAGLASAGIGWAATSVGAHVTSGIAVVAFLVPAAIYAMHGPGCRCYLRTAVQVQELFSLRRWRSARRALEVLRPLIEQAQGSLTAESIETGMRESASAAPSPAWRRPSPESEAPLPVKPYQSMVHSLFFAAITGLGVEQAGFLAFPSKVWLWAGLPVFPLALGFGVLSLVRQRGTDLDPRVRGVAWAGAAYLGCEMVLGYISALWMGVHHPEASFDIVRRIEVLASMTPKPWSFSFVLSLILAAAGLLLGLTGLALRARNSRGRPSDEPPLPEKP
jgi:hypothetical protein